MLDKTFTPRIFQSGGLSERKDEELKSADLRRHYESVGPDALQSLHSPLLKRIESRERNQPKQEREVEKLEEKIVNYEKELNDLSKVLEIGNQQFMNVRSNTESIK